MDDWNWLNEYFCSALIMNIRCSRWKRNFQGHSAVNRYILCNLHDLWVPVRIVSGTSPSSAGGRPTSVVLLLFTTYLTNYDVTVTYHLLVYLFTTHNSRDQSIQLIRRKISLHNQSNGLFHFGGNFWWGEREESKSLVGRPPAEEGEVPETIRTGTHKSCKLHRILDVGSKD